MNDPAMTNVWLAILACVSLAEFLMIVVGGFLTYRMYGRAVSLLTLVEREHIAPLHARVDAVLDELEYAATSIKRTQASMSAALHIASSAGELVADRVRANTWPIIGIFRGLRSAVRAITANAESTHPSAVR
jgi:hypothetical protein